MLILKAVIKFKKKIIFLSISLHYCFRSKPSIIFINNSKFTRELIAQKKTPFFVLKSGSLIFQVVVIGEHFASNAMSSSLHFNGTQIPIPMSNHKIMTCLK